MKPADSVVVDLLIELLLLSILPLLLTETLEILLGDSELTAEAGDGDDAKARCFIKAPLTQPV